MARVVRWVMLLLSLLSDIWSNVSSRGKFQQTIAEPAPRARTTPKLKANRKVTPLRHTSKGRK